MELNGVRNCWNENNKNVSKHGGYWAHFKALVIRNLEIKKRERRKTILVNIVNDFFLYFL